MLTDIFCDILAYLTDIFDSRFILDVLTKHGHGDLALTLATNPSCPSWSAPPCSLPVKAFC